MVADYVRSVPIRDGGILLGAPLNTSQSPGPIRDRLPKG